MSGMSEGAVAGHRGGRGEGQGQVRGMGELASAVCLCEGEGEGEGGLRVGWGRGGWGGGEGGARHDLTAPHSPPPLRAPVCYCQVCCLSSRPTPSMTSLRRIHYHPCVLLPATARFGGFMIIPAYPRHDLTAPHSLPPLRVLSNSGWVLQGYYRGQVSGECSRGGQRWAVQGRL